MSRPTISLTLALLLSGSLLEPFSRLPSTAGPERDPVDGQIQIATPRSDRYAQVRTALAQKVEVLRATGGLPAHVVGQFRDVAALHRAQTGEYYVFDRLGHSVYRVDLPAGTATKLVQIGPEPGRILSASAFSVGTDGGFVVADAPNQRERVQIFSVTGERLGGFSLPGRALPRLSLGNLVLSGVASLQYTGRSIVMSQPEMGGLITEFDLAGRPFHTFGTLRATGHEQDRDVHLALNSGLPLVSPASGYYFVFRAGAPVFRRYDEAGNLVFERHIEGRELDPVIADLPTTWPRRPVAGGRTLPLVAPTVRTAAVDPDGNLWVALTVPYTYVYNPDGEKIRTVQFHAAGLVEPESFSFESRTRLLVTPGCYAFTIR